MEYHAKNMGNTEKNTIKHGWIGSACLGICAVIFMALSAPASAQTTLTPTPFNAIQSTATAAAVNEQAAQAQQAEAERIKQQADYAAQQATDNYQRAQQETAAARAALQAQQYQQAGEALGRAETNIEAGRQQLDALSASYAGLSGIVASQASTITQQASDLNQCHVSLNNYTVSYKATAQQLENTKAAQANPVVLIAACLIFVFLISIISIFLIEKWRNNVAPVIVPDSTIIDDGDEIETEATDS